MPQPKNLKKYTNNNDKYMRQTKLRDTKSRLRNKNALQQSIEKKICLTMIVRNESCNMNRILDSVKSIIDMVSIVDTGSTDDTISVITEWSNNNNIPTTIHHEPFKDFSYNRTHSVRIAKETYPDADYFLLSDADFVWEVDHGDKFNKIMLLDHKYLIEQYNKCISYWNIRLLSSKIEWECVGLTHEYWNEAKSQNHAGEVRTAKIHTLVIDDREDGGCKEDKFERDELLLRRGLFEPKTSQYLMTRYKFYLAQTLKDLQRFEESIEWYTQRIFDKGWPEEVYYSKFQIGYNYEQLGWIHKTCIFLSTKPDKTKEEISYLEKWNADNCGLTELIKKSTFYFSEAGVNYTNAHNYRPSRSESLYYMTRMYRMLSMNKKALNIAKLGKTITYPAQDTLFIERACYDYLFDYEIAIVASNIPGERNIGRQAILSLNSKPELPHCFKDSLNNLNNTYNIKL